MYTPASSFTIDRWFDRLPWPRRWSIALIGIILLLILAVVIWLSDAFKGLPTGVAWFRPIFPPIVIVYLLVVVQLLQRTREEVARSLRPLVLVDDETYVAIVRRGCRANPVGELVGFGIGAAFFLVIEGFFHGPAEYYWVSLYYYIVSILMFGVLGWSVHAVIAITQLTNRLLRQPIALDIFNVIPLEPIGTQSLHLSLSFLGAAVISFPSSPYPLLSWQSIAIYSVLASITVLVFFLNMYRTHRLLATTKRRQMASVEHKFAQTYHQLRELTAGNDDSHMAATELNAWAVAKQELKLTRTWPYNTEMLRTLFVSVLIPIVVGLARLIGPRLIAGN